MLWLNSWLSRLGAAGTGQTGCCSQVLEIVESFARKYAKSTANPLKTFKIGQKIASKAWGP